MRRGALLLLLSVAAQQRGAQGSTELNDEEWLQRTAMPAFSLGPAPYPHHSQSMYELFGDAYYRADHIEVTQAKQGQKGAIWSKHRLEPLDNWQVDFSFRVGMHQASLFGDGFAFWYALDRGRGGNAMGGPNVWKGLGIFFDTYKNKEHKGKKHPFVYGVVNNGNVDYEKLTPKQLEAGCHIPFRGTDQTKFLETQARVTLLEKTVTVVMRPVGSLDWVECFEIKDVELPPYGYFGVTAMTGDLVDNHQMTEIKAYGGIKQSPYEYAVKNDLDQTPEMWMQMLYSGEEAKEYSRWEKKIIEETEFDPNAAVDPYMDPYREPEEDYAEEGEGAAQEEEEEPEEADESTLTARQKLIRQKRAIFEGKKGKRERGVTVDDPKLSMADMETLEEILSDTKLGALYQETMKENRDKIVALRQHMEAQVNELSAKLTSMARDIKFKEHAITTRIYSLADKLHVDVIRPLEEEHKESSRGWLYPFLVFMGLVAAAAAAGYSRYKSFMKTHLL